MPDWAAYEEASKRGILPEDKAALYEEAKRRGLVPRMEPEKPTLLNQIGQGAYRTAENIGSVYPAIETGLNLLTSAYGVPASGLAFLAGLPFGKPMEALEATQKALIYQPQTQRGQELTGAVTYPFQKLSEGADIVDQAITEAGYPKTGAVAGGLIEASPLLLGLRGKSKPGLTPTQARIAENVQKYKIPVSPKEYAPSATASAFQIATDWFPSGRVIAGLRRRQIPEAIMRMREDFISDLEGITEPTEMIRGKAQKGMEAFIEEQKAIGKEGYKFKEELGGPDVRVPMPNTIAFIEEIKPDIPQKMRGFLNDFTEKKRGPEWSGKTIDLLQSQAYSKTSGFGSLYWDLMEKVKQDLQAYDQINNTKAAEKLAQGKAAWREMLTFESNPLVKSYLGLNRWGGDPSMLKAFSTATADDTLGVKKIVTPETWSLMKTNLMQDLIDSATRPGGEGQGNMFSPGVFADSFFKLESKIKKVYPEHYEIWKDFSDTMRVASKDMEKIGKGEGWWMGSALLGAAAAMAPEMLIPTGFSAMVANSLMNPRGWLRKWLTGSKGSKLPGSLKVGTGIVGATQEGRKRPYMTIRPGEQSSSELEYRSVD